MHQPFSYQVELHVIDCDISFKRLHNAHGFNEIKHNRVLPPGRQFRENIYRLSVIGTVHVFILHLL